MNPFSNLPPGCDDSDIPGNRDEDLRLIECRDCAQECEPDELDGSQRCEKCANNYDEWVEDIHLREMARQGKTWDELQQRWITKYKIT